MPTITVGELRRLIASTSYEKFARDGRPQVRGQSTSVKRDRSRSRSRTRSHHTRPQSADKRSRPQSATVVLHYRPQKPVQTTPRKRPQSANSVTCVPSHDVKKMDFTGLSNMMQSMSVTQSSARRGWKSKSVDFSEPEKKPTTKKSNKTETCDEHETKTVDMRTLRNNRSSSFSKFKYPLTNQGLKQHMSRMYVEENIPASLKRLPKYQNQPRLKNCSYTPPGVCVTKVKQHSVLSKTLPPPPPDLSKKPPLPPASKKKGQFILDSQQTNSPSTENFENVEDIQLNATYHFVHNGQETQVMPLDDADFLTPRDLSPEPVIVTVQETPRDNDTARLDTTRVEKLQNISEDINKKEKESDFDKQSNTSDDSFLVKDNVKDDTHNRNNLFGSSSDLDKHSYGDMNDLESVPSELSINSNKKWGDGFKANSPHPSSDDEIEEDIPEEVNVPTTISFTSHMGGRSLKH